MISSIPFDVQCAYLEPNFYIKRVDCHMPILDVTPGKWLKVCRVRRIGSDCTSGHECSRSVAIQIDTAELVSQTATLHRPRALLPAIIGCDLFAARKTVRDASPACLLPLPACCHQLPPPATPAAAACFANLGPRSPGFGGHPKSFPFPLWKHY